MAKKQAKIKEASADVKKAPVEKVEQPKVQAPQNVTTISQAIHVLVQAADLGRKAGIYDWEDLRLIGQSMALITSTGKAPQQPAPDVESDDAEDLGDTPNISEE